MSKNLWSEVPLPNGTREMTEQEAREAWPNLTPHDYTVTVQKGRATGVTTIREGAYVPAYNPDDTAATSGYLQTYNEDTMNDYNENTRLNRAQRRAQAKAHAKTPAGRMARALRSPIWKRRVRLERARQDAANSRLGAMYAEFLRQYGARVVTL